MKNNGSRNYEINTVYLPGRYGFDRLLQEVLRYLVLFTAVLGVGIIVNGMSGTGERAMLIASFYTFTTFYLLFRSLKGLICGAVFGAVGMGAFLLGTGLSLKEFFIGGFKGIFNAVLDILHALGYSTVSYLSAKNVTQAGVFVLISALPALVVALSCRKKTRCLPYAVLVLAPTLAYVLGGGDIHLRFYAPAVAAAVGMAVMEISDRGSKTNGRSAFTGFLSFALACILLVTPIVNADSAMGHMSLLPDILENLDINGIFNLGGNDDDGSGAHSAVPKRRVTTGRKIMNVYTDAPSPVYLRTWTGGEYKDDQWYPSYYDGQADSLYASVFDAYTLTKKYTELAEDLGYSRNDLGFGISKVYVELEKSFTRLPMPSMGGRIFGTSFVVGSDIYVKHDIHDGVGVLSSPFSGNYATEAVVFDSERELFADVLLGYNQYMEYYVRDGYLPSYVIDIAHGFTRFGRESAGDTKYQMNRIANFAKGVYYAQVTDEAVIRAVDEIFDYYDIEKYYVQGFASSGTSDQNGMIVRGRAVYYLSEKGMAHARDIAAIVADYLDKNCEYSNNPKKTGKGVAEELLYGSKEGYCVQFATVGALIMRRLGFAARFAEGYIAQEFSEGGKYGYTSRLTDREGHAWVEIWVNGFGWMTCEMTPGYGEGSVKNNPEPPVSDTTEPDSEETTPDTTPEVSESETSPVTTPESSKGETTVPDTSGEGESGGNNGGRRINVLPFIAACAIMIPSVAFLSSIASKARKKKKRAEALIARALSGDFNSEEKKRLAAALERALALALKAYGALPRDGELPEDYGARLEGSLSLKGLEAPISLCVEALCRQAYGFGMEQNDLKVSALVLKALRSNAREKLGLIKFAFFRLKGVL